MEMCRNRSVKGRELNIFVLKQSWRYISEGPSWVPVLLAFLEFLTLVLEVWKILPTADTAPLVCLRRAGWHIGGMLGGQRAGESLPGCLLPACSGQHCESSPDLKESGEIYADTWFHIWKCWGSVMILSIAVILFFSKTSTYLTGKHSSFQTPRAFQQLTFWKWDGFAGSAQKVKFSSVFAGKIQSCVDLLPVGFWSKETYFT